MGLSADHLMELALEIETIAATEKREADKGTLASPRRRAHIGEALGEIAETLEAAYDRRSGSVLDLDILALAEAAALQRREGARGIQASARRRARLAEVLGEIAASVRSEAEKTMAVAC